MPPWISSQSQVPAVRRRGVASRGRVSRRRLSKGPTHLRTGAIPSPGKASSPWSRVAGRSDSEAWQSSEHRRSPRSSRSRASARWLRIQFAAPRDCGRLSEPGELPATGSDVRNHVAPGCWVADPHEVGNVLEMVDRSPAGGGYDVVKHVVARVPVVSGHAGPLAGSHPILTCRSTSAW